MGAWVDLVIAAGIVCVPLWLLWRAAQRRRERDVTEALRARLEELKKPDPSTVARNYSGGLYGRPDPAYTQASKRRQAETDAIQKRHQEEDDRRRKRRQEEDDDQRRRLSEYSWNHPSADVDPMPSHHNTSSPSFSSAFDGGHSGGGGGSRLRFCRLAASASIMRALGLSLLATPTATANQACWKGRS